MTNVAVSIASSIPPAPTPTLPPCPTLTHTQIQAAYGVGRDLALALTERLPHATLGKTRIVRRTDVDAFFEACIRDGEDLWGVLRRHGSAELLGWLRRGVPTR